MPETARAAILEACVTALIIAGAVAMFADSLGLPTSVREPLGSASIPRIVCVIVIALCILLLIWSMHSLKKSQPPAAPANESQSGRTADLIDRYDLAGGLLALAVAYVALMQSRAIPSVILTPVFLGTAILVLNRLRRQAILPAILIALVIGLGTNLLFTRFFYVDLP